MQITPVRPHARYADRPLRGDLSYEQGDGRCALETHNTLEVT